MCVTFFYLFIEKIFCGTFNWSMGVGRFLEDGEERGLEDEFG